MLLSAQFSWNYLLCDKSAIFTRILDMDMAMNIRYGGISKMNVDGRKVGISHILLLNSYTVETRDILCLAACRRMSCITRIESLEKTR